MLHLFVKLIFDYLASKKTIATFFLTTTGSMIYFASANYTDVSKVEVLEKIAVEKAERVAWQESRREYGERFIKENDQRWDQQMKFNDRFLDEIRETHKDVKEILKQKK